MSGLKDFDRLAIVLDPADVRAPGTVGAQRAAQYLRSALINRENVPHFCERVSFAIGGFDDDPRELHEIEEVRLFMRRLDRDFPFWFHFCDRQDAFLRTVLLCLETPQGSSGRTFEIPPRAFERFIASHLASMLKLREEFRLMPPPLNKYINDLVHYFRTPQEDLRPQGISGSDITGGR